MDTNDHKIIFAVVSLKKKQDLPKYKTRHKNPQNNKFKSSSLILWTPRATEVVRVQVTLWNCVWGNA